MKLQKNNSLQHYLMQHESKIPGEPTRKDLREYCIETFTRLINSADLTDLVLELNDHVMTFELVAADKLIKEVLK